MTAGVHEIGYTWVDKPAMEMGVWEPTRRDTQEVHMAGGMPRIRGAVVEGPYAAKGISANPARDRIFVCKPTSAADETACAEKILTTIARRAYRRPVTAEDMESPLSFYADARKAKGGDFDAGIRVALARILASPSFIFRAEHDASTLAAGAGHRVSQIELASRLSFFLWSSIPDDELMNAAVAAVSWPTGSAPSPGSASRTVPTTGWHFLGQ